MNFNFPDDFKDLGIPGARPFAAVPEELKALMEVHGYRFENDLTGNMYTERIIRPDGTVAITASAFLRP